MGDMAQRHEIEAWVNPEAWDDRDEAMRVVDAIEASGSDDEVEWVRLADLGAEAELSALSRARDAQIEAVRARAVEAVEAGELSEVAAARGAGVTRVTLRKWLGK